MIKLQQIPSEYQTKLTLAEDKKYDITYKCTEFITVSDGHNECNFYQKQPDISMFNTKSKKESIDCTSIAKVKCERIYISSIKGRPIYCIECVGYTFDDIKKICDKKFKEKECREKEEAKCEQEVSVRAKRDDEFWEQYDIPFNYFTELKIVTAYLNNHNFTGNGKNFSSHLFVHDDFTSGKLKRNNEYLCKPKLSRGNINPLHFIHFDDDGVIYNGGGIYYTNHDNTKQYDVTKENYKNYNRHMHWVTCKKCLEIMERWKKF